MKQKAEKFLNTALGGNMNIATLKPLALIEIMTAFAEIEVAAITVTHCCTELKADKKEPTFEEWIYMNNYTPKVKQYIDENSIIWTEHELIKMYNEEVMNL